MAVSEEVEEVQLPSVELALLMTYVVLEMLHDQPAIRPRPDDF